MSDLPPQPFTGLEGIDAYHKCIELGQADINTMDGDFLLALALLAFLVISWSVFVGAVVYWVWC